MAHLISPDRAGTLSAVELENLEAELAPLASGVSIGSPQAKTATSADQRAFDASLASGGYDARAEAMTQEDMAYFEQFIPADKIERWAKQSGVTLPPRPADPALLDLHRDFGVAAPDAKASDYEIPDLGRLALELSGPAKDNIKTVTRTWASELRLDKNLGAGVIDHVIQAGATLAQMSDTERSAWSAKQEIALSKAAAGDKAKIAEIRANAGKVLAMSNVISGVAGDEKFSAAIVNGAVGRSAWLLQTLSSHYLAMQELEIAKKRL